DFPGGIARGVDDIIQVLTGDAAEWKQRAAAQRPEAKSLPIDFGTIILICWVIFIIVQVIRSYNQAPLAARSGRRDATDSWWVPSSGGWSSGSSDSSWGSGGGDSGFSGGGGDSGGGGASGSW